MTRFTYLAYPIDQAVASSIAGQRFFDLVNLGKSAVGQFSDIIFDPGDAFSVHMGTQVGPEIAAINAYAAMTATAVLAFLPAGMPTIGVPMEIDRAANAGKRVAIVTDAKAWMLSYDRPEVRLFPLDEDGTRAAAAWLGTHTAVSPVALQDPLAVVVGAGGILPSRGHADDAGLDLYVSEDTTIPAGAFHDVPCGVKMELPEWSWGMLTGRSSTLRSKGLLVHMGIIDSGYRGELFAGVWNQTSQDVVVKQGERIAQLVVMANVTRDLAPVMVDLLSESDRGSAGFGSTGA